MLLLLAIFSSTIHAASSFILPSPRKLITKPFQTTTKSRQYSNIVLASSIETQINKDEEIWHPRDPASTTPQLLHALWFLIVQGCSMTKGQSSTIIFPNVEDKLNSPFLERLMGHLDVCKDVCDDFGVNTILSLHQREEMGKSIVDGFTIKSFRNPNTVGTYADDGDFGFAPDPFWDNDDDLDSRIAAQARLDEEDDVEDSSDLDELPEIVDRIPEDDDMLVDITKKWVKKVMSDMGVCPFTVGSEQAGLPLGDVFYTTDRSTKVEDMYRCYWNEVVRVEQSTEKDLSTTLLIAPSFYIDNVELFENFSNTLTQPLETLQLEDLLQLVFFHPEWTFRDGGERSGDAMAANYARRSPWPMINILRTTQVRAAQRGIPTGLVYKQNEKTLNSIGSASLEKMLRLRDWADVESFKVDRRDMEALRVAQDLQTTGVVAKTDTNLEYDSTPAANKVGDDQVEGSNMINVMIQALDKRLNALNGEVSPLTGGETSAAMMASDFLLKHLSGIERGLNNLSKESSTRFAGDAESDAIFGGGIDMGGEMDMNDESDCPYSPKMNSRNF